jgi:Flp pilus assembly pilin Flp
MKDLRRDQSGQGMTEYILIVALIAIAVIGAVKFFGGTVKSGFQNAGNQLGAATSGNSNGAGSAGNLISGKN